MPGIDLDLALQTARRAAEAGSTAGLRYFRRDIRVELKPDRTPVTVADRESEAAILGVIRAAFPEHSILGEESGAHAGATGSRWIVDPVDGTRGFTRGEQFWGPLVALEHEGEIVAGALALPALEELYFAARGRGAWMESRGGQAVALQVSGVSAWEDATLSLGEPAILLAPPYVAGIERLATTCARTRCWGDLAGFVMVLTGRAEAWIEAGVKVWDLAPMKVLVEEAGGTFSDLEGRATIESGACVVTNGRVHQHVLATVHLLR